MTYVEIRNRLDRCERVLTAFRDKSEMLNMSTTSRIDSIKQLEEAKLLLKQKLIILKESTQGVIATDDDQKAKELAKSGANVKLTSEGEGVEFTAEETRALAKEVVNPLVGALRKAGDEVSRVILKEVSPNKFTVHVIYKNDFEDEFTFYIEGDTLFLNDESFNKEIGEVGIKPSGEAIVHKDSIQNELMKHFNSLNEEDEMSDDDFDKVMQAQIDQEDERRSNSHTRNYDDAEAGMNEEGETDRQKYIRAFDLYKQNKNAVDNEDLKKKLMKAAKKVDIKLDLREGELFIAEEEETTSPFTSDGNISEEPTTQYKINDPSAFAQYKLNLVGKLIDSVWTPSGGNGEEILKSLEKTKNIYGYSAVSESKLEEVKDPSNSDVKDAYREAYTYETGLPFAITSFEYDSIKPQQRIQIKNLVSNEEELGDVTLIKTPEGWRLGV
jgi:DNA-binding Lrp family transcriptional regulator